MDAFEAAKQELVADKSVERIFGKFPLCFRLDRLGRWVGWWVHLLVVVVRPASCLAKDKYRFLRLGYNRRVACHENADRNSIGRTHRTREGDCHPDLGGGREVLYVVLCTYFSHATTTTTCS